jgi:hypothetical protein
MGKVAMTWTAAGCGLSRVRHMDLDDYLRDEAAKYRKLAAETADELKKRELLELAVICDEAAEKIEDRMTAG